VQKRTAEQYQGSLLPFVGEQWSPAYDVTESGQKSYPYRFRSKNQLPNNRLTLRLDVQESPSPTLDGLIPITMGTTLAGEELFCFVPPHAYERLKQVCVEEISKKPKKSHGLKKAKSESVVPVGVVQRNYADLIVEPTQFQLAAASGKPFPIWSPTKPKIDFSRWVTRLSRSERPTPESYKLSFGKRVSRTELFRLAAERKHLFKTFETFLHEVAPELFKHTDSFGGSPDPRKRCRRCGGNWLEQFETWFQCLDCGQYQYVGRQDEFSESEQRILAKSREGADFGEMAEQTIASKQLSEAGFDASEKNTVTLHTSPSRSNEKPNIARMTSEEFVSVLLNNLPRYNRTENLMCRLTVLSQYFLGASDLYLRDHVSSLGISEETGRTWVKNFRKQVDQHRALNRKNLTLSAETEERLKSVLINRLQK
jgi:hypothetical protein